MTYIEQTDNSRLKILLITSAFPPPCDGGSLVYLYETVKHLPPDEIIVSTSRRNQPGWEEFDKGQRFKVIRSWLAPHCRRNPFKVLGMIHRASLVIWFFQLFYQILRYRVNMLQAGHPSFFNYLEGAMVRVLSRLLRKPYILYAYGEEITQVLAGSRIERALMSWVLRGAFKVITISDFSAKRLMEAGVKSGNIEKICPGVDTNLFHPSVEIESVIKKHNLEGREVILTLGRLVERKGYDYVIKSLPTVLEKVPNLIYIIAGRGPEETRLKELVKDLHLEDYVTFAGYIDAREVPAFYNACDVFIMANRRLETAETEGFGIVFTEANACGKPVIGGKAGGTSDAVLDGYTGILVDGTDCAQISSALIDILTDKELANQLGSNGRKRVEAEFNWKRNAERIRDICLKALHNKECTIGYLLQNYTERIHNVEHPNKIEPGVDVIICTYNNLNTLLDCLESVRNQDYGNLACFVIDDCSTDGTQQYLKEHVPWVRLIEKSENSGPARSRNMGIDSSSNKYIVTLDDDVRLEPNCISQMVSVLEEDKSIGIAASKLLFTDNVHELNGAGGWMNKIGLASDRGRGQKPSEYNTIDEVFYACSAAMIVRRELIEKIGGFDESYFYGLEDTDLAWRMWLAGARVVYIPSAVALHRGSSVVRTIFQDNHIQYLISKNAIRSLIKNYELKNLLKYTPLTLACYGLRWLYSIPRNIFSRYLPNFGFVKAVMWNLVNISNTLQERRRIQHIREVTDARIMHLMDNSGIFRWFLPTRISNLSHASLKQKIKRQFPQLAKMYITARAFGRNLMYHLLKKHYNVIFQVTNKCNSRCVMCFNWRKLNTGTQELSISEVERLSKAMGPIRNLTIGGGEPFLREDLPEICGIFCRYNNVVGISIPTNCLLPHRIDTAVREIMETCTATVNIVLSLDGIGSAHDEIRGVEGNFDKVLQMYSLLKQIDDSRLLIGVNTTISNMNQEQIPEIAEYVKENMHVANHYFEMIRGDYDSTSVSPIPLKDYERLVDLGTLSMDTKTSYHTLMEHYHKVAIQTLREKRQIVPCKAGFLLPVIDACGNVYPCEILEPIGNLRDYNFDWKRIWKSTKWKQLKASISDGKCFCTHVCFLIPSMEFGYSHKIRKDSTYE